MPNILLLGNNKEAFRFVQEALNQRNFHIDFLQTEQISKNSTDLTPFDLVIFDLTNFDENELNWLFPYYQQAEQNDIITLALIPENHVRLKYRINEIGIDDYLSWPFDKLDIQIRCSNLLRMHRSIPRGNDIVESFVLKSHINKISASIGQINRPIIDFDFRKVVLHILRNIGAVLDSEHVLYFEIKDESKIILRMSIPEYDLDSPLELPISDLSVITKSVKLKENTIINQLKADNPLYLHLKSILNLDIRSIALFPILEDGRTRAILLLLRTHENKFQNTDFVEINLFVKLIQFAFRLKQSQELVRESFDGQIWKYSYEFLEHTINQLNFGIVVVDQHRKIRFLNLPAAEIMGVKINEALYKPLYEILGAENAQNIFAARVQSEGTYERPELEIKQNDGEKILIGFSLTEYKDSRSGDPSFIISLKDITYSKEMQEEMRRMDRLASLGVMASGIAHEIRNPLAGIKAIAQTFEEELSPDDPKNEFVKRIIRQVNRLDEMLKTLFSYAKPQKPNRMFHDIEGIVQDVLALLKQKIQQHKITLSQSFASGLPKLFVDNGQIQQVIFNLILNSIEAIRKEGEITISIESFQKQKTRFLRKPFYKKLSDYPYVLVHISDNGCGIPRENLYQIFNPFFTTKTLGTGLGLSIVYQIVKENNGIIYFESEESRGTNCYLFLPAFDYSYKMAHEVVSA